MAQGLADRLLTIAVTATVTSAAWVVAGSLYFGADETGHETGEASAPEQVAAKDAPQPQPAAPANSGRVADSAVPAAGALMIPVANVTAAQLTDSFRDERGGGDRVHEALDIMAPAGTPVVAAAPGTIERLFASEAGGNTIYVRSPDRRTIHYYAHLREYAPGLEEGQAIARGQRLGTVGSSGNASEAGPHLHFAILRTVPEAEWWEPTTAMNPYPLLRGS